MHEHVLTSGRFTGGRMAFAVFCKARICSRALNGALQIGQLFAWYLKVFAQELHKHRWRQGSISVSRTSLMQTTHSDPLSSVSSSPDCCKFVPWIKFKHEMFLSPYHFYFQYRIFLAVSSRARQRTTSVLVPSVWEYRPSLSLQWLSSHETVSCLKNSSWKNYQCVEW